MKKIILIIVLISFIRSVAFSQQVARARHVNLVTTTSPSAPLNIVIKGGISYIGNTTSFLQHGDFTLLSNPISGNSDWLDSTGGVITIPSTGMVNFRGASLLQQLTGPTRFYGLTIDNIGVNLNQSNEVRNQLNLNNGLIYFTNLSDSIYVSNPALTAVNYNIDPFTITSWVHGKLSRKANLATPAEYFFPIGKIKTGDSLYAPVKFEKQNAADATWTAHYFPEEPIDRANKNPVLDHISKLEYWEITSHDFAAAVDNNAQLSLSWRTYSIVSPDPAVRDSLMVAHYFHDGTSFQWQPEGVPPPSTAVGTVNFGFVKSEFVADYTQPHRLFTLGTRTIANPLPLNLIDYYITLSSNVVTNYWKVVNDAAVKYYEVERGTDGVHFQYLTRIYAARRPDIVNYSSPDPSPVSGWNYYRLKIIDDQNNISYSEIRKAFIGDKGIFTIYPNPAGEFLYINLPSSNYAKRNLKLIDNSGKIISTMIPQSTLVRLSLKNLPGGTYYVRYEDEKGIITRPFIHVQ